MGPRGTAILGAGVKIHREAMIDLSFRYTSDLSHFTKEAKMRATVFNTTRESNSQFSSEDAGLFFFALVTPSVYGLFSLD